MNAYPRFFLPLLWFVICAASVTGILLIPAALERRLEWEPIISFPAGWGMGISAMHALLAFGMLTVLGALTPMHMRAGWRRRKNHGTGLLLVGAFVVLALSALGIYYIADESLGVIVGLTHTLVGLLVTVPIGVHALKGRQINAGRRDMAQTGTTVSQSHRVAPLRKLPSTLGRAAARSARRLLRSVGRSALQERRAGSER